MPSDTPLLPESTLKELRSNPQQLKVFLDRKVERYNNPSFIEKDPISIPHRFEDPRDIEIMAFFAAIFAWGRRQTIINKCERLIELMEGTPFRFIREHTEQDLKRFLDFKHRTFQPTDALYFIYFLNYHYQRHETLEAAFTPGLKEQPDTVAPALTYFYQYFFSLPDAPERTRKHIATPEKNSTCKRLNMFLRWMVRKDEQGVDFGLWEQIHAHQLICPIDVHVNRVARQLGLLQRKQTDWKAALELTDNLRQLAPEDPVKYDFALFGLGSHKR
jgi:uncharacterized protein (TIGR02757 family)